MQNLPSTRAGRAVLGAAGLVLFIALWKAAQSFEWVRQGTMPGPFLLPQAFLDELQSGRLLPAIGSSLVHYAWGLALGSLLGFLVGLVVATARWMDALHAWLARILRPIPPLAWVVFAILVLWQLPHTLAITVRRRRDYEAAGVPTVPSVMTRV